MDAPDTSPPSFSAARRWLVVLNTVLAVAAALGLVVMANYLARGYFKRYYWSRDTAFRLSPESRAVLDNLTNDVTVTIFFQPNGDNQEIYSLTTALLAEYQNANPRHIHVNKLDYTQYVGEAKALLAKYSLSGLTEKDFVFFEGNGHTKIVYARQLAKYDFDDLLAGRSKFVRRSAFLGEVYFTGDIYAVSNPQALKAYFLYGHGEKNPGDPKGDDGKLSVDAYSKLAAMLKDEINSDWDRLSLQGTNVVPADCQLLIVAGPRQGKFPPNEVAKIAAYLKQGGRLLALLTTECGLEPVLADWGVRLGRSPVVDLDKRFNYDGRTFFTCTLFPHPIINPLASEQMSIRMVLPRPVFKVEDHNKIPGAPDVKYLAATSPSGMDEDKHSGEFPLLAAVEQGVIQGVSSSRGGGTRIVVAGDADFLDDEVIDTWAGNHYFAGYALNWLLDRPQLLLNGVGPQPIREYKLYMTHTQLRAVQWLFLAGLPGAVLALGGLVWLRRRN
jgi:hypothetical protein